MGSASGCGRAWAVAIAALALLPVRDGGIACAKVLPHGFALHRCDYETEIARANAESLKLTAASQIHQESAWREKAVSPVGASGLMQLMPATRDWLFPKFPECRDESVFHPPCNLRAGIWFDLWAARRNRDAASRRDQLGFMLASYNAGPGWIDRERKLCEQERDCDSRRWFGHVETRCLRRASACAETRHYARKILGERLSLWKDAYNGYPVGNAERP